jgi:hypothetical protein
MSVDWVAVACAIVGCIASFALVLAKTRLTASLAFALVAVFAGLTAVAVGVFSAGLALISAGMMIALVAMVAAGGVGEIAAVAQRPAIAPLVACAACLVALVLAWPNAPATPALTTPSRMVAFDVGRGTDVFIALAGLVAAGMGVTALIGFGARGVFGADKDRAL